MTCRLRIFQAALSPFLIFAAVACSDDPERPNPLEDPSTNAADDAMAGDDMADSSPPPGYPEGPYGESNPEIGSVIENLSFVGFVNPTGEGLASERDFGGTDMASLRESGAEYMLVVVAAMWCISCKSAARDLGDRSSEIIDAGGSVVELVVESNSGSPPSQQELAAWVNSYDLGVTTVAPATGRVAKVFPEREYAYIIHLPSMEVVWRERALFENPSIASQAIDHMLANYL